mgnify:FL=1
MSNHHFYEVDLKWKEGRIGELSASSLSETIEVATPPEFPKGVPNIWSPEHLYAAAINSCFMTTFLSIAENSKLEFESFECKTIIKMERIDKQFLITEATIKPLVQLVDTEKDLKRAMRVFEMTNKHCLVTNSMKTKVFLDPKIKNMID